MVILATNTLPTKLRNDEAKRYFEEGKYTEAYLKLAGEEKFKDKKMQKEFDKITLMYDLEHRWERYEFFVKKKEYEFALNELLMGYGVSDKQMDKAKIEVAPDWHREGIYRLRREVQTGS